MKLPPIDRHTANLPVFIFVAAVGFGAVMIQSYYQEQALIEREQADALAREKKVAEWRAKAKAKEDEPASNWYAVRGINVLAFVEGDDTQVSFDREIKQPFTLDWTLQAYRAEAGSGQPPVCVTGGRTFLTPNPLNEITVVPWSDLWGKDPCNLKEGNYILKAHGVLKIVGYPEKEVERASNIFRVLPKGSQLFLEPEQAQKLESIQ